MKYLAIDQGFLTALQKEDASKIYIADPTDHVDKGFAGIKDMRSDLLAPFIAASIDPVQIHLDLGFWLDMGAGLF